MQNEISYGEKKDVRSKKSRAPIAEPAAPKLALFSLIADPKTIAGDSTETPSGATSEADQELDRLRQALHARERELETLRSQAETRNHERENPPPSPNARSAAEPAPGSPSTAESSLRPGLLDATQAHRMAKEARQSEQASRLALQAAQAAQKVEAGSEASSEGSGKRRISPPPLAGANLRVERPAHEQSWETRPLSVQRHLLESEAFDSPRAAAIGHVHSASPEAQLRAARAEARELEATLSLARDTALSQKLEIARLRSELASAPDSTADEMAALDEAFRSALPEEDKIDTAAIRVEVKNELRLEMDCEHEATRQEIERLKERIALAERESDAREAERRILRETLAAQEAELETARAELEQLAQRLDEEGELAQQLHASLDEERQQNANAEALLSQLRDTLQRGASSGDEQDSPRRVDTSPHSSIQRAALEIATDQADAAFADLSRPDDPDQHGPLAILGSSPEHAAPSRSGKLFAAWQDDQVRRHFGPFGIDTARDLVTAPLLRRNPSLENPGKVLLLGKNSAGWAEQLAEDLISNESPPFQVLHAADADLSRHPSRQDRPIDEFIAAARPPESPHDFDALLAETRPSVIVLRNFLSGMNDVAPWLDVLRRLPRLGPSLIFLEATGVGPITPVAEMVELGNRIWSLMPARYKREGARNGTRIESWQEAFLKMQPLPANGLRAALRQGFELEISAQFGFLTEPFLRTPVEENFDPSAQRDRRFLHQIADLDDRKIEAGVAPALHFVARVDGRIEE